MNILCVIEDLGAGGAQRQLVNLALYLKKEGHEISFLTYFHNTFYLDTVRNAGIGYKCIEIKQPLKRVIQFRKFIRSGKYDVILAFLGVPAFLTEIASLPNKKWKLIVGERSANPGILKSKKSRFLRFFHLFADHVVANSYANMSMVKKVNPFLPEKKCHVIYNAIDLEKYKPLEGFQFKKNNRLKIIVPASYRRLKNLMGLIEAVNLLSEQEKEKLQIDWYGDKWANPNPDYILAEAKSEISRLGLEKVFTLQPATWALNKKIQEADVVGLFSYFEGLPNAICEGMACGKPVIASAVSDLPFLLKDESSGKLCDPKNINSIKESIQFFLHLSPENMKKMGHRNYYQALNNFASDKIYPQYLKFFE